MSVSEKRRSIDPAHPRLSIQRQCELIGLPRSGYYRPTLDGQESPENLELMRLIDEEYTRHPFYGSRQMRNWLRRQGRKINRKRIQRLMRKMGLQSVAPKPDTSKAAPEHKVYPYLLGGIDVTFADQAWCSDITYIRMQGGFVYLTAVMDWYSRFVLSWEISVCMDSEFCVSALERALRCYDKPAIFNTDQGHSSPAEISPGYLKSRMSKSVWTARGALWTIFL
jgi:putative transposase